MRPADDPVDWMAKRPVTAPAFESSENHPVEALFVREFRTLQALLALTREEQAALLIPDIPRLLALAERREALLDRLAGLESQRRAYQADLAQMQFGEDDEGPELGGRARLERLSEGIEALAGQVREMARRNRALADGALQQASRMQAGLVSSTQENLPALIAAILDAREAIESLDHAGVEAAVGDLQKALQPSGALIVSATNGETALSTSLRPSGGLVETMASLHRQEKAYRAVLQGSLRVIAGL